VREKSTVTPFLSKCKHLCKHYREPRGPNKIQVGNTPPVTVKKKVNGYMNMKRNGKVGGRMILDVRINGNCYIFALLCGGKGNTS
jgi:hypothetical protein